MAMRVFASCAVTVALCVACGHAETTEPRSAASTPSASGDIVDPANIMRVRTELPAGYEVADLAGPASPLAFWGLGARSTAEPPQCVALAEPVPGASARGWSASGPGGIVYAVVIDAEVGLDPALIAECGTWTVSAGHTNGVVTLIPAPAIERAATIGMATDAATSVEGGTETHSRADTFGAFLSGHVVYVTVVSDPGSTGPILGADYASALLAKTVSALRP